MANANGNIIDKVARVSAEERISAKTQKPYNVLLITFINGYEKQIFLDGAEVFAIKDALNTSAKDGKISIVSEE